MCLQICAEMAAYFRGSIMANISACHADDPGSIPGRGDVHGRTCKRAMQCGTAQPFTMCWREPAAETQDRTGHFQIFGMALSQQSYRGTRTTGIDFFLSEQQQHRQQRECVCDLIFLNINNI